MLKSNKNKDRFIKTYSQGNVSGVEVLIDKETGVNYVFAYNGYAGGLTVLLDRYGKPVITPVSAD